MYSMHNEGKSVVAERFIRALKNVDIEKLDDIVNKYNDTYHSTINIKPADVKPNTYAESSKDINMKNAKFKISDTVRISKYKNMFTKGYTPNWSEEVFMIKKVKNTFHGNMLLVILKEKKLLETFTKNIAKKEKNNQKEFRVEKVIKGKSDKFYVK